MTTELIDSHILTTNDFDDSHDLAIDDMSDQVIFGCLEICLEILTIGITRVKFQLSPALEQLMGVIDL